MKSIQVNNKLVVKLDEAFGGTFKTYRFSSDEFGDIVTVWEDKETGKLKLGAASHAPLGEIEKAIEFHEQLGLALKYVQTEKS